MCELFLGPGILVDVAGIILPGPTALLGEALGVFHQAFRPFGADGLQEVGPADLQDVIDEALELRGRLIGRCPLKMTRSKQDRTQEIRLANLAKKEHTVFMASAF